MPRLPARRTPPTQPHRIAAPRARREARVEAQVREGEEHRLVIVSNRIATGAPGGSTAGGLAGAVLAALRRSGGIWFGWSGEVTDAPAAAPTLNAADRLTYATLDLARQDYEEYYNGFANRVLWPLFHYRPDLVGFQRGDLAGYMRVNRQFAAHLSPLLQADDLVWVHDYHFLPLGEELRRLGVEQPIGFFLHTPFPAAEVYRLLPNHAQLMRALCAYDLVGFQTRTDLEGFTDYLQRRAGATIAADGIITVYDRRLRAGVFPIGIDVDTIADQATQSVGSRHIKRLGSSLRDRNLVLGVDRLDYSKGLPQRFEAFERLIEMFPETRGHVVFMQIAPPTRSDVPEYLQIRRSLEAAAGHINGRFAEFDWTPLRYLNKSFNQRTLCGFLRAARIGMVTPMRDGMNLVAKEYVASQDPENPGVLVLSSFAGAAGELRDALLVNPYDVDGMAEAMQEALIMPPDERRERWQAMMSILRRNDITAWRENFVRTLAETAVAARA
jgi:trehalose 6-phosphate synthase